MVCFSPSISEIFSLRLRKLRRTTTCLECGDSRSSTRVMEMMMLFSVRKRATSVFDLSLNSVSE